MNSSPIYKTETIEGPWQVYFDEKLGGIGKTTFEKLQDWTTFTDPKIKYYSGTAIYKKSININFKGRKTILDIGNPNFAAQIFVNGKNAGTIWCSPWQLDISSFLKDGANNLEIHVANSLMNRMIYDSQLPEKERVTYSYPEIATSTDVLETSGLTHVKLLTR